MVHEQHSDVDQKVHSLNHTVATDDGTTSPPKKAPQSADENPEPPRKVTGFLWILVVVAIMSSTLLFALDNTITADVQPAIVQQFDSISRLPWIAVSFMLGAASINFFW